MSQADILRLLREHPEGLSIDEIAHFLPQASQTSIEKCLWRMRSHGEVAIEYLGWYKPDPRKEPPLMDTLYPARKKRENQLNLYYAKI